MDELGRLRLDLAELTAWRNREVELHRKEIDRVNRHYDTEAISYRRGIARLEQAEKRDKPTKTAKPKPGVITTTEGMIDHLRERGKLPDD